MVSTNDFEAQFDLKIYPNPAGDWLRIESDYPNAILLELQSVTGHMMLQKEMRHEVQLNTNEMPEGLYFLKIGEEVVKKIVIQRN